MQEWVVKFIEYLQQKADKVGKATGQGSASFDYSIRKTATGTLPAVTVMFKDYMRFLDMKNVHRGGDLPVDEIEDWVKSKGLAAFKKGKYNKPSNLPEKAQINRIAWAIARHPKKMKRQPWYNKTKGNQVYALYFKLLDALLPVMLNEVKSELAKS